MSTFQYEFLLTGSSGFLGRTILQHIGRAKTLTLGRDASNNIKADFKKFIPELPACRTVVHSAGKAHVIPKTDVEKQDFFAVNHAGTLKLLKRLEDQPPERFVFISSVAVYGREQGESIDESAELKGSTPYALSKIYAENAIKEWCVKRSIAHLILRLPLVVGLEAPGNLSAISNMIKHGRYIRIAGNHARKSMVLAEDVAAFIGQAHPGSGTYNLTDGIHPAFSKFENGLATLHSKKIQWTLPLLPLKVGAKLGDFLIALNCPCPLSSDRLQKMISSLTFCDNLARKEIGWQPRPVLNHLDQMIAMENQ